MHSTASVRKRKPWGQFSVRGLYCTVTGTDFFTLLSGG
uniref:Uncharacterized protein n=1 Tax=Anguilla anguilla TaxID=7936 RepID=A0A0E9RSK0_ANGAN